MLHDILNTGQILIGSYVTLNFLLYPSSKIYKSYVGKAEIRQSATDTLRTLHGRARVFALFSARTVKLLNMLL